MVLLKSNMLDVSGNGCKFNELYLTHFVSAAFNNERYISTATNPTIPYPNRNIRQTRIAGVIIC